MSSMSRSLPVLSLALLLGGALGAWPGTARANATHTFTLTGQADHQLDCWENLPLCEPGLPPPPDEFYAWTGTVTLVLDTSADGVFNDDDVVSFDVASNILDFYVPGGYGFFPFSADITVANGVVTSMVGGYDNPDIPGIVMGFNGLSVSFFQPAQHHYGQTTAVGTLIELPEPGEWLLMLGGLAVAAAGRRGALSRGRPGAA